MTSEPLILSLGWTLLHSLWQLGAIALVLYALLRLLSGYRAESRYLLACTALALCLLAPLATFSYLYQPVVAPQTPNLSPQETMVENQAESAVSGATVQTPASPRPAQSAAESPAITSPATPVTVPQPQLAPLQRLLPYLVISWLFGVTLLSLKLCLDLIYVSRVRRRSTPVAGGLMQHLESLKRRIGISRTVSLLQTKLCDSPSVIGIFRPVVLLPVSVMTGLSEEQLTAILLHELAHIRRHDYLINLLQSIIETLLFYHPAVWWVSGQIRAEREYACDDMVVRLGSHPVSYARALAELESLRHIPKLAIAASHTNLTGRVKRLLGAPQLTPMRGLAGVIILTVLASMSLLVFPTAAQMDEAVTEDLGRLIFVTATDSVIFSEDARQLEGFIGNDGYLLLEERQGGQVQTVRVTADGDGALVYDYRVNGDTAAFGDTAQRWFSAALDAAILKPLRERPHLAAAPVGGFTNVGSDVTTSYLLVSLQPFIPGNFWRQQEDSPSVNLDMQGIAVSSIFRVMHARAHGVIGDQSLRTSLRNIIMRLPDGMTLDTQALSFIRLAADEFDNQDFRADILQRVSDLEQQSSTEDADRMIFVTVTDNVVFSDDFRSLERFVRNLGYLIVEDRQADQIRKVVVTPLETGELVYDYQINGRPATFDADAEQWFQEALDFAILSSLRLRGRRTPGLPPTLTGTRGRLQTSFIVASQLSPLDAPVMRRSSPTPRTSVQAPVDGFERTVYFGILNVIHSRSHRLMDDDDLRDTLLTILDHPQAHSLDLALLRKAADEFDNQDFRADILQRISDLEQQRSDSEASHRRILVTASEGVIFNEDYTALEGFLIEADYLLLEDRQPEMTQTVRVSSRAGALIYDYRVNGETATFDEEAEGWFRETLNYAVLEPFQNMLGETGEVPRTSIVRYEPILASFFVDSTLRQAPSHIRDFYSAMNPDPRQQNIVVYDSIVVTHARAHEIISDYQLYIALLAMLNHASGQNFNAQTLEFLSVAADKLTNDNFRQGVFSRIKALEQELRQQG